MRLTLLIITVLGALALILGSCDDSGGFNWQAQAKVAGAIDASPCGCSYAWGPLPQPYTPSTGRYASITFENDRGYSWGGRTDDSSLYGLKMPTGTYRAIIESPHSWPDTITDIHVGRDTSIDFCFRIAWQSPDTISARFTYLGPPDSLGRDTDSLGRDSELVFINILQEHLRDLIDSRHAERVVRNLSGGTLKGPCEVLYRMPIGDYPMWYVYQQAVMLLAEHQALFPQLFEVRPDILWCLDYQEDR